MARFLISFKCKHSVGRHCRRVTHAETQNSSLKKNIIKRERRGTETLINTPLVKETVFYRLNERFVSNSTGSRNASDSKYFANDLPTRAKDQTSVNEWEFVGEFAK